MMCSNCAGNYENPDATNMSTDELEFSNYGRSMGSPARTAWLRAGFWLSALGLVGAFFYFLVEDVAPLVWKYAGLLIQRI